MPIEEHEVQVIPPIVLRAAQLVCTRPKALPADWSSFFPEAIKLRINKDSRLALSVRDLFEFVEKRIDDAVVERDSHGLLEASQCLALLYYLDNPGMDVRVMTTTKQKGLSNVGESESEAG